MKIHNTRTGLAILNNKRRLFVILKIACLIVITAAAFQVGVHSSGVSEFVSSDMSIDKSHSGFFVVGMQNDYFIDVFNGGDGPTTGPTTVTDNLPVGLTFIGTGAHTDPSWNCVASGQVVTCSTATILQSGDSLSIDLVVAVGSAAAPSVTNTATVSTASDGTTGAKSASDPTTVNTGILSIQKSGSPNSVLPGGQITYTLSYSNPYTTNVTNVRIADVIPTGTTFVSASTGGTLSSDPTNGPFVSWNVGTVNAGASGSVSFIVAVNSNTQPPTTIFNGRYTIQGDGVAPETANAVSTNVVASLVTSISPASGPESGGTNITISGQGFTFRGQEGGSTAVTVGGTLATNIVVVNDTTITATTPAGRGQVAVIVNNGASDSNSDQAFTYLPPPLPNGDPAIMGTISGANNIVVFPQPGVNLPAPSENAVAGLPANALPQGVSYFGSDQALISDFGNSRIFVVRVSNNSLLDTINTAPVYDGTGTVAVAPNLQFALASGDSQTLAVISAPFTATSKIATVHLPGSIAGYQTEAIVFSSTGRAFVYNTAGISVLDSPYTSVAFTIPYDNPSSGAIMISPDGKQLAITDFSATINYFQAPFSATSQISSSISIDAGFSFDGIATRPDGSEALVVDASGPRVFVIEAPFGDGPQLVALTLPPAFQGGPAFEDVGISADGQLAIVTGNAVNVDAPALFLRAGPQFSPGQVRAFAVSVPGQNGHSGRGAGSVRFLPPGLAPGLTVSKSAPASVASGGNLTYTITYGNTGTADVAGVTVTDAIPAGTTFVSSTSGGTLNNGVVTWTVGTLPAGTVGQTLSLTVKVNATSGNVTNDTYAISGAGVPAISGPPITTIVLQNVVDLALSQTASPDPVTLGSNLSYTIKITNAGPASATGIVLTDSLPSGATFVSALGSQGNCTGVAPIICNLGSITAGGTATVTVVVTPTTTGSLSNQVSVTSVEPDLNTDNNTSVITTTVLAPPKPVVISLNPNHGPQTGGNQVTITGKNFGPGVGLAPPAQGAIRGRTTGLRIGTLTRSGARSAPQASIIPNTSVMFGTVAATNVVIVNDTTITCTAPPGTGVAPVTVTNSNGTSNADVTYTYEISATISSVNPTVGAAGGGTPFVITGANFNLPGISPVTVKFGNVSATQVQVINSTTITGITPAGTGTVPVTITTANGVILTGLSFTFTTATLPLTVTQIGPAQSAQVGGVPVTISGTGFLSGGKGGPTTVLFGSQPASNVVVVNDTTITAVVPPGTGIVDVTVSNNNGAGRLPAGFTYVVPPNDDIIVEWYPPNDSNKPLPPPRDVTAQFSQPTGAQANKQVTPHVAAAARTPLISAGTTLIGYNVYRGFDPNFQITDPNAMKIGSTPANSLVWVDSADSFRDSASGLGVPFYRVTALYKDANGNILESPPSEVASPSVIITGVSVVGTAQGRLIHITGFGFATFRAIVEINGMQITAVNFPVSGRLPNGTSTSLEILDKTGNLIPVGSPVNIRIINPLVTATSGQATPVFVFRRLPDPPPVGRRIIR